MLLAKTDQLLILHVPLSSHHLKIHHFAVHLDPDGEISVKGNPRYPLNYMIVNVFGAAHFTVEFLSFEEWASGIHAHI